MPLPLRQVMSLNLSIQFLKNRQRNRAATRRKKYPCHLQFAQKSRAAPSIRIESLLQKTKSFLDFARIAKLTGLPEVFPQLVVLA